MNSIRGILPSRLRVSDSTIAGRGVFATNFIQESEVIDVAPVVIIDDFLSSTIRNSKMAGDYFFVWGDEPESCPLAIACGLVSLCNYSSTPNSEIGFDYLNQTLKLFALEDIRRDEEVLIKYRFTKQPYAKN